tara:strand:- start:661 stop:3366 length:2706 start_codon:yes stop_codon:yes gene_type:complete
MNITMSKRKSAMLLYSIEEYLGSYVLENESSFNVESPKINDIKVKNMIEKSYLDDIFKLVLKNSSGSSKEDSVKRLYKLFVDLKIFEIRNAIAHPNRPFLDYYWYRVAAIAADPAFERIGIKGVKAVLYSAEKGIIDEPPEGWEKRYTWEIPNNLPSKFESDITGLIGRNKEISDLKGKISSPRNNMAAIIAPGGFGKTAVALDLLKEIVTSPDSAKWVDAVAYITLKNETWLNGEFIKLDASSEISAVEQEITDQLGIIFDEYIDDIDQAFEEFSDKRVILCIDNLETIIRDAHEVFDLFVDRLPREWKVIVTSRIDITNAYIFPLKELKEGDAIKLARIYNRNSGGDELSQSEYSRLAKECHFNPLAIKMTLDLYLTGKPIPESISEAKDNIAYFSFNNLVESLSDYAQKILELIFIQPDTNRKLSCEILDLSDDEAASSINELSRTSLITRISDEGKEFYEINGSIKDLLVLNPRCLRIRGEVQDSINRKKTVSHEIDIQQKASKLPKWHFQYIPPDSEQGLKLILKDFAKIRFIKRTNPEKLLEVYSKFDQCKDLYKDNHLFLRSFGKILESINLAPHAENVYKEALSISNDLVTSYLVARFYFEQKNYPESLKIYIEMLPRMEGVDKSSKIVSFYDSIYQGYFLCCLYLGKYQDVIDHTKKWKESEVFRALFGTYRASAYKRKIEVLSSAEHQDVIACLRSATKILDDVLRTNGYANASCVQGFKIIEEVFYFLRNEFYCKTYPAEAHELLIFCDKHLMDIVEGSKNKDIWDAENIIRSFKSLNVSDNPFVFKKQWKRFSTSIEFKDAINLSEIDKDHSLTKVVRMALNARGSKTNFLFAEDHQGVEYFTHFQAMENCNWDDWLKIQKGNEIAVFDFEKQDGKTAMRVKSCSLIQP